VKGRHVGKTVFKTHSVRILRGFLLLFVLGCVGAVGRAFLGGLRAGDRLGRVGPGAARHQRLFAHFERICCRHLRLFTNFERI